MDDLRDVHLAEADWARLLEESRRRSEQRPEAQSEPAPDVADLHPHLSICAPCREQFHELILFDRQLKNLKPEQSPLRLPNCPEPAMWRQIAGGLTLPDETLTSIEHASRCDYCGPLLREAVAELSKLNGEVTDAERKYIAALESASAEWQRDLARRITGTANSGSERAATPWWRKWIFLPHQARGLAMAGASLVAIVAVASWAVVRLNQNRHQPADAEKLLARAYAEKRTLELRIAGASYAPLRISRGPAASFTSRPPALLKAEALIASQMEDHPSDASWLQAQAQADVLEGKYDAAVEALRRALELAPHSPTILTDLATAYFQRALQEDRKDDFGAAYEYLSQALKVHPDDPVALFNRAIVAEHQFLYHQALEDWDRYLQVDPRSDWSAEAREAADRVRARLKEHDTSQAAPLLSPAQILAAADNPNLQSTVDARIEEYLSSAIRSWLPQAYPVKTTANPATRRALFFLADLTAQRHSDRWLSDLLRGSSASNFPQAVAALARAAQANDAGEYATTRAQAAQAEYHFRSSSNAAGVLRAQFEQIYAMQIERHSEACRRLAMSTLAESDRNSYAWLQIQLGLEKGVCSGLMGDIGADERASSLALERAGSSAYGALYLRAAVFAADDKHLTGDQVGASLVGNLGLERFWSGQFPPMRGYNLYVGIAEIAEGTSRPNLQVAVWREALALIDRDPDLLLRAIAHRSLAEAAAAARLPGLAEQEYDEASRSFKAAPPTEAIRSDSLEMSIRTARLATSLGRFDDAVALLSGIQDQVRGLSNNFLVQMFYSTLGEMQLSSHHESEAEQALKPALALAEQNLASLRTDSERGSWTRDAAPAYLALVEAQLVQGRSQDALETFEWYLGAPQRAHSSRTILPESKPSELNSRFPLLVKQTVLAYAALPHGLAIWIYDDRGLNTRWIPQPNEDLQELANGFYVLASDPRSEFSALRRDARSLYAKLVLPVEPWLAPQRTLVIEADGWLSHIPFEVLLDSNDHYLLERAPIVHSLGQDSDARLHSDGLITSNSPLLVVGSTASSQAQGLIPIPDLTVETDAVAGLFRSPRVLNGSDATLANVQTELPSAFIFHFAGHSLTTADKAGLLLENGGAPSRTLSLLDAGTLRRTNLRNLRLAVLSACGTASTSGDSREFNSVTDAFLRAGVPHVVASRWAVDSVDTHGFVEDFYHTALSGQPVSEALRHAALHALRDPRTAHPYYWSAFSAYGRP